MRRTLILTAVLSLGLSSAALLTGCKDKAASAPESFGERAVKSGAFTGATPVRAEKVMSALAADYVRLALAYGHYDKNYVDAFTGDPDLYAAIKAAPIALDEIKSEADQLMAALIALPDDIADPARLHMLKGDVTALQTRIAMSQGQSFTFDEETLRLYGAVVPPFTVEQFDEALAVLEAEGGSDEPVIIPEDKVKLVMETAIAECRRRTKLHYDLPESERFDMEFVTDKPWSAYNWYKGDYRSVIQINLDQPMQMDRVLDLGCHEGYPGHHVFNVLAERDRIKAKGWSEGTVVPLYSPAGPIMEGSGNYGLTLAFPGDEKAAYERDILAPLAGMSMDDNIKPQSEAVKAAKRTLDYVSIYAAREYLDGRMSPEEAADFLVKYSDDTPSRALQRLDFFNTYRGYIINYTLGQHVIGDWVEMRVAQGQDPWEAFAYILNTPVSIAKLQDDLKKSTAP